MLALCNNIQRTCHLCSTILWISNLQKSAMSHTAVGAHFLVTRQLFLHRDGVGSSSVNTEGRGSVCQGEQFRTISVTPLTDTSIESRVHTVQFDITIELNLCRLFRLRIVTGN